MKPEIGSQGGSNSSKFRKPIFLGIGAAAALFGCALLAKECSKKWTPDQAPTPDASSLITKNHVDERKRLQETLQKIQILSDNIQNRSLGTARESPASKTELFQVLQNLHTTDLPTHPYDAKKHNLRLATAFCEGKHSFRIYEVTDNNKVIGYFSLPEDKPEAALYQLLNPILLEDKIVGFSNSGHFVGSPTSPLYKSDGTKSNLYEEIFFYDGISYEQPGGAEVYILQPDGNFLGQYRGGKRNLDIISSSGPTVGTLRRDKAYLPLFAQYEEICGTATSDDPRFYTAGKPTAMIEFSASSDENQASSDNNRFSSSIQNAQ